MAQIIKFSKGLTASKTGKYKESPLWQIDRLHCPLDYILMELDCHDQFCILFCHENPICKHQLINHWVEQSTLPVYINSAINDHFKISCTPTWIWFERSYEVYRYEGLLEQLEVEDISSHLFSTDTKNKS